MSCMILHVLVCVVGNVTSVSDTVACPPILLRQGFETDCARGELCAEALTCQQDTWRSSAACRPLCGLHCTPHSNATRSTHQSAVIARFQGKTCHGGLFPGHTLHPCVSPCWHPCGHMLQAVSPLIVESCPALPPFAPTHASPASRHCRHSHKTHYSSSHSFQSPKVQISSPNPKSENS